MYVIIYPQPNFDGLMQDCRNSIANTLRTRPLICDELCQLGAYCGYLFQKTEHKSY